MIPPWSEAERARINRRMALLEQTATGRGLTAIDYFTNPATRTAHPRAADIYGLDNARIALKAASELLDWRACLARAEQADTFEGALRYIAHVLTGDPAAPAALAAEQAKERAEQAEAERDTYRAVLVGAGYEKLDDLPSHPGGVAFATALGKQARTQTLAIMAERDEARDQVEHWRSHYEAAIFNWNQTIAERDVRTLEVNDLRQHIIPVADRERAASLFYEAGRQSMAAEDHVNYPPRSHHQAEYDRLMGEAVKKEAEARRLIKLASPGTKTEDP